MYWRWTNKCLIYSQSGSCNFIRQSSFLVPAHNYATVGVRWGAIIQTNKQSIRISLLQSHRFILSTEASPQSWSGIFLGLFWCPALRFASWTNNDIKPLMFLSMYTGIFEDDWPNPRPNDSHTAGAYIDRWQTLARSKKLPRRGKSFNMTLTHLLCFLYRQQEIVAAPHHYHFIEDNVDCKNVRVLNACWKVSLLFDSLIHDPVKCQYCL